MFTRACVRSASMCFLSHVLLNFFQYISFTSQSFLLEYRLRAGDLTLTLLTFGARQSFPTFCGMLSSSIPGFYPLNVSCPSAPSRDNQQFLQMLSNVPRGRGAGIKITSYWELLAYFIYQEKGQTYKICDDFRFMEILKQVDTVLFCFF